MASPLPRLFLARHGDTDWTDSRQRTGRTDLPLNQRGEERACQLGEQLKRFSFARVFTSPLQRASKTCALAGFAAAALVDPDLLEWDYGRFEGRLTPDILKERPGWELYRDGCPDGESPDGVAQRADRFIARARGIDGDVLAFSSGHIIRMIAARWLGLPPAAGRFFFCRPASVGVLAFEHSNLEEPIIGLWNFVKQQPGRVEATASSVHSASERSGKLRQL
jgi:probable phosphoglycerate mutase